MKKIKYLFFALRPKQWVKNLFIFLPMVFGKKLFAYPVNLKLVAAFFLFSIMSGVVYLINDIVDAEKDKTHPTKRFRPIASGKLKVQEAWMAAIVLGAISIAFSFLFDARFGLVVVAYLILNLLYSKILKDLVIIDVFCIGAFYLFRIIAGGIVAEVQPTHWIIFLTALLALFLGFNKRRQELRLLRDKTMHHRYVLIKYNAYFIDQMIGVITSSIVVVYMLYAIDAQTITAFGTNHLIYSIPFVYYGIFRYLYTIHKLREDGDPTRALLSDKMLQLDVLLWMAVCVAVIYFKI